MIWLAALLVLGGCTTVDYSRYARCIVQESAPKDVDDHSHWTTVCLDGTVVDLREMIPAGYEVIYTPYQENSSHTTYGYIKQVLKPVQKTK